MPSFLWFRFILCTWSGRICHSGILSKCLLHITADLIPGPIRLHLQITPTTNKLPVSGSCCVFRCGYTYSLWSICSMRPPSWIWQAWKTKEMNNQLTKQLKQKQHGLSGLKTDHYSHKCDQCGSSCDWNACGSRKIVIRLHSETTSKREMQVKICANSKPWLLFSILCSQAVSISLFCAGFGESMAETINWQSPWAVRVISLCTASVLLVVVLAGVKWVVKLQLLLLAILMLSVLDFVVGTFAHTDKGGCFEFWAWVRGVGRPTYERVGDACWEFLFWPLRCTKKGMVQAIFNP